MKHKMLIDIFLNCVKTNGWLKCVMLNILGVLQDIGGESKDFASVIPSILDGGRLYDA